MYVKSQGNTRKSAALFSMLVLSLIIATSAFADGKQDFTLRNHTGFTIVHVYVSPHRSNSWGDDILGQDVLNDTGSVHVRFHRHERADHWDLKVVDQDKRSYVWENFNLAQISDITIHYHDGNCTATTR